MTRKTAAEWLEGITVQRWQIIGRRCDLTMADVEAMPQLGLAIAANEAWRDEHGHDDWARFLGMSPKAIAALDLFAQDPDPEQVEAAKSSTPAVLEQPSEILSRHGATS